MGVEGHNLTGNSEAANYGGLFQFGVFSLANHSGSDLHAVPALAVAIPITVPIPISIPAPIPPAIAVPAFFPAPPLTESVITNPPAHYSGIRRAGGQRCAGKRCGGQGQ